MVNGQFALVEGPYTRSPKLTTGAGDNFNAGFCFGQVQGFNAQESLILGVATSGLYVRNGRSASQKELMEFLALWSQHVGEDFAQQ
jgi:sugar/nucleoside kinase (ribokinase family)